MLPRTSFPRPQSRPSPAVVVRSSLVPRPSTLALGLVRGLCRRPAKGLARHGRTLAVGKHLRVVRDDAGLQIGDRVSLRLMEGSVLLPVTGNSHPPPDRVRCGHRGSRLACECAAFVLERELIHATTASPNGRTVKSSKLPGDALALIGVEPGEVPGAATSGV